MKTLWSECDIKKSSGSAETWLLIFATQEAPNHNELFQYTTCCTVNTIKKKKLTIYKTGLLSYATQLTFLIKKKTGLLSYATQLLFFINEQSFSFSFNAHIHFN